MIQILRNSTRKSRMIEMSLVILSVGHYLTGLESFRPELFCLSLMAL